MKIRVFDPIVIPLPERNILSRLGFVKKITRISSAQDQRIRRNIQEAVSLIQLKGALARLRIEDACDTGVVVFPGGIEFKSRSLTKLLSGCDEAVFIGTTAGKKIARAIRAKSRGSDLTAAVVFDAVASEMTDEALSWICRFYNRELLRENKCLTKRRFSAGYGDLLLDNQKIICKILRMDKLGVKVTKNFLLDPEKSVTAVAGIRGIKVKS